MEYKYKVDKTYNGWRLDKFLSTTLSWVSRNTIHKKIEDGKIKLIREASHVKREAQALKPSTKIITDDTVTIAGEERKEEFLESLKCLEVLYEDQYCLAVNKPYDITVHPTKKYLFQNVLSYLKEERPQTTFRLLHRLDKETSGVLLLSKDMKFHFPVAMQFERREIQKEYVALVHGKMEKDKGIIDLSIGKDKYSSVKMKKAVTSDGKKSVTEFEVIKKNKHFTLVKLKPKTGRRHQLRVHLSHIGHPIVGDKLYGGDDGIFFAYLENRLTDEHKKHLRLERQALHARALHFFHPILNKKILVESPIPSDMIKLIESEDI